ncbi:MAG: hypothetical protein QGH74_08140 [Candidatus Brocadiia bacterium]|nr:hypothetical protein [Candidatus Brocadiia bacterium]
MAEDKATDGGEPQDAQAPPREDVTAVLCEGCGRRFRAKSWREGMACPKCRSGDVKPVAAPGGAVDYYVTDRSSGFAHADIRFAQWAKWLELITPAQYEKTLLKQNRLVGNHEPVPPIHEVIVSDCLITEAQATGLLEFMALPRPDEDDAEFLELLARMADAPEEKVNDVKTLQRKAAGQYHEVPPICQLLVERRVINEAQLQAMLKFQRREQTGCPKTALDAISRHTAGARVSGRELLKRIACDRRVRRGAAIGAGVLALALLTWGVLSAVLGAEIYVKCTQCGVVNEVELADTFPVECPTCGGPNANPAFMCSSGHVVVGKLGAPPAQCPICGVSDLHPLADEEFEQITQ